MAYALATISENSTFGLVNKEQTMSSQATKRSAFTILQSNVHFKQKHSDIKMKIKNQENLLEKRKVQIAPCEFKIPSFKIFSEETEKHEKIKDRKHLYNDLEDEKENLQHHNVPDYVAHLNTCNDSKTNSENKLKENDLSSVFDLTFSETKSIQSSNKQRKSDNVSDSPYCNDICLYLKEVEKKFQPRAAYMKKQPDITLSMRSVLVDWLVEVGEEYKLHAGTLYLAISYIDRFLSSMSVLRGKLQLVGTACMFIAAKYEEIYPPELKDFVYITDDTYSKKQVLRMEHLILKVLEFELSAPTAHTFLHFFCNMSRTTEKACYLSQYICELSLLEADPFLKYLPSEIAAGSLIVANYTLGFDPWNEDYKTMTGYKLSDLIPVITSLYSRYRDISKYPQQSIYEKYKSSRFQRVSNIEAPEELMHSLLL